MRKRIRTCIVLLNGYNMFNFCGDQFAGSILVLVEPETPLISSLFSSSARPL
jgi:hypothetical protein